MELTQKYLKKYVSSQPFSIKGQFVTFAFSLISSFFLSLLIFGETVFDRLAYILINEQYAPVGVQFFCSISVIYLTERLSIFGPVKDFRGRTFKWLGVYIGNFGIGLAFTLSGIMFGSLLAVIATDYVIPEPYKFGMLVSASFTALLLSFMIWTFHVALVASGDYLPFLKNKSALNVLKGLAWMFLVVYLIRLILLLALLLANKGVITI
ncbi:hypothetical protein [Marinobacter subterrani]|uniref:hypothetical protein n=1 Tax=Marinobacter subterrani TaxID=1658765 RepID=UPI002354351A|nr:hypothetical protein [Marinobacter subterrani]